MSEQYAKPIDMTPDIWYHPVTGAKIYMYTMEQYYAVQNKNREREWIRRATWKREEKFKAMGIVPVVSQADQDRYNREWREYLHKKGNR